MAAMSITGRSVFVTGAASGIGYEICLAFARAGADIIATDIDEQALQTLKHAVQETGRRCHCFVLDVSDEAAFGKLADDLNASRLLPHVVINNAGVAFLGSFTEQTSEIWQRILNINLMGVVNGCHAFLPHLLAAGDPRCIVNVASLASIAPLVNMSAYAASKYAVHGLSEVLAMEMADSQVTVTCVHPGIINTPIVSSAGSTGASISDQQLQRLRAYYRDKGCSPSVVARDIVRGVIRGQASIFTGSQARITPWLKRLCSRERFRNLLIGNARKIGYLAQ